MSKTEVEKTDVPTLTMLDKFNAKVSEQMSRYEGVRLSDNIKRLISSYYIKLQNILTESETKRDATKNPVPFDWTKVNFDKFVQDAVSYATIGFDPIQKNVIFLIPYFNKRTNKYDINFMEGFKGKEIKVKNFGIFNCDVTVELVYQTDTFVPIKKDKDNLIETYEFKVNNAFERGELKGGFYYLINKDDNSMNKVVFFNCAQIEKRKPEYASPEFWGGEKDEWANGKRTGKKIIVEGWKEEMYIKTLFRHAYDSVAIDASKIDQNLLESMIENDPELNSNLNLNESNEENNFEAFETIEPPKKTLAKAGKMENVVIPIEQPEIVNKPVEQQPTTTGNNTMFPE